MFEFSLQRIYYYIFFRAAYAFLTFWIGITYAFKIKALFIEGIIFYIFAALFHKAILKLAQRTKKEGFDRYSEKDKIISKGFFFALIIFSGAYLLIIYWIQHLTLIYLGVSNNLYKLISSARFY